MDKESINTSEMDKESVNTSEMDKESININLKLVEEHYVDKLEPVYEIFVFQTE